MSPQILTIFYFTYYLDQIHFESPHDEDKPILTPSCFLRLYYLLIMSKEKISRKKMSRREFLMLLNVLGGLGVLAIILGLDYESTGEPPVKTPLPTPVPIPHPDQNLITCGGLRKPDCPSGSTCRYDNFFNKPSYPDESGVCVPDSCGGFSGTQCPHGYICLYDGSKINPLPDASGSCAPVPDSNPEK